MGVMDILHLIGTNNAPLFSDILKRMVQRMRLREHGFDLPAFKSKGLESLPADVAVHPQVIARIFAKEKAVFFIGDERDRVISFHSVGILKTGGVEEEILNPKNWDEAEAMLRLLSGKSFEYFVAIAYGVPKESGGHDYRIETCSVTLSVQKITDDDIEALRKNMEGVSDAHVFGRLGFGYRPLTWPGICECIEDREGKKQELASKLERVLEVFFPMK
jgi:predicted house-cleaning NTP pyrophosphatase (Maf/HAM1 superfamily)